MTRRDARAIDDATRAQIRAAAPGRSSWVSANAGSGKTRVLTDRVARLLLSGAEPQRILCLTYTKAAASEMQNRLFRTLGGWAMMEDAALAEALQALSEEDETFDAARLGAARRLFAKALETPGGLKIQTIHAFCDALLRRFPLEAGVSPRFDVLDDRRSAQMIEAIRDRMAAAAEAGEDMAFDAAADRIAEGALDDLIRETLARRAAFPLDLADPDAALAEAFGIAPGSDPEAEREALAAAIDLDALAPLAEIAEAGGKRPRKWAEMVRELGDALDAGRTREALIAFERLALKADGEPFKSDYWHGKKTVAEHGWIAEAMDDLAVEALNRRDRRLAIDAWERSRDLHRFARALLRAYEAEKTRAGALDFEDLVARSARLLTKSDMAAWALWKLDGGIDHLLIDEAQDTAPAQWAVIRAVADEFFAGAGARDVARTLFVVGDEKQSIYSFQGADPREFGRMRAYFETRLAAAETGLHQGSLAHSFRSAPAILSVVDRVFEGAAAEGLNADGAAPRHLAFRAEAPGLVEMWPFFEAQETPEEPDWADPIDAPPPSDPRARLAVAVAEHVDALLREGARLPDGAGGWRPMRPGDVLILVQRRDRLARGIIRGLKSRGVDVAGEDRLLLTAELAVKDLAALIRIAADEDDDLSLAAVLRSPLCGLSEEDLFSLAAGRGDAPLRRALLSREAEFPQAAALVRAVRDRADFDRPYELLERVLIRHDGRARLLARLGPEAEDPIDELLAQALDYERMETPTLTGFLAWLDADDREIKREQGGAADEVRVMTVHGAKGLEAPFVILPDAGPRRRSPKGRSILRLAGGEHGLAVWARAKPASPQAMRDAQEELDRREEEESRRLLYVALTRAESRLLVCGAGNADQIEGSWYDLVRRGLEAAGAVPAPPPPPAASGGAAALRLAERWRPAGAPDGPSDGPAGAPGVPDAAAPAPLRALTQARAPSPAAPPPRLNASALGGAPAAEPPHGTGRDRAVARLLGDAVHLLLERLPEAAPEARADLAAALLASEAPGLDAALRREAAREALDALALPELAALLGPGALTEAGFSVAAPDLGARVTGRVDLLRIDPQGVTLIDYKTGAAPARPEDAPEAYLRQMAAYRAAMRVLHPGAPVRAGLLWTRAGRIDWLPDAVLDAAWDRLRADDAAPAPPPPAR